LKAREKAPLGGLSRCGKEPNIGPFSAGSGDTLLVKHDGSAKLPKRGLRSDAKKR
jgi:hypothetical protein